MRRARGCAWIRGGASVRVRALGRARRGDMGQRGRQEDFGSCRSDGDGMPAGQRPRGRMKGSRIEDGNSVNYTYIRSCFALIAKPWGRTTGRLGEASLPKLCLVSKTKGGRIGQDEQDEDWNNKTKCAYILQPKADPGCCRRRRDTGRKCVASNLWLWSCFPN